MFLSYNFERSFSLIKMLSWFDANLQRLLLWWLKFSVSLISVFLISLSFFLIDVNNLVNMISFVFTNDYRLEFTWIHNQMIIFKPTYCYLTFCFQNTSYIFHRFSKTLRNIVVCKIKRRSNQCKIEKVIEKYVKWTYN